MNILVLKSSVNERKGSYSSTLSDLFVKFYREINPQDQIEVLDLNKFDIANINLTEKNFEDGSFYQKAQSDFWIDKLKKVDKVVFSTSMTNFNYSATTKNFFDAITIPNQTFSLNKETGEYHGLLNNIKNVQILTAQGAPIGWYPFGNHTALIKQIFEFLGAKIVSSSFVLAGTKVAPANQLSISDFVEQHRDEIKKLAQNF
ncbi:FMN-dependent NADH-azoreductase [Mesomycoplasma ovipneumoniae]|uniref:FMN dependent NADH:quinone oxidoreductase n=1 Tax=Mesomycoplasma ovipneumoniae TaxID=29562 RepID=A0AAJ2UA30_9BACT|nr:FMN-dependent NADH-azoreductase [Mesomycoplasma ovipneumoniae]MDW2829879.1 FMN-dependent NADH-azoreductase [Mesomycoplasma ovipneumoniae]MDW2835956.1 FMN-dependent NADH-azoreductase [Mesomycoplasma ovipneumoniae]MDW2871132.1 FMN-dependent NADH-azoreductase [Mesomycoplasma ovipneumoniae]MDW2892716.1 FMN-dependent NADH-azoreductase [Mesomycoplasma ovipneumoniae]MDW2908437.1 FMN-dependent NADH-azoreductase [Mesomycoplasma ovipneumoniae]